MYKVKKTYGHELGLSACFRQWRAKSHCRFLHGYALSFTLTFGAVDLDECGWVIDFGGLKPVKEMLVATFDHRLVVAADDPQYDRIRALGHPNGLGNDTEVANVLLLPSVGCEAFAAYVYDWVTDWLGDMGYAPRVHLIEVAVSEHGGNAAIYTGDRR